MSPAENVRAFLHRHDTAFTMACGQVLSSPVPVWAASALIWFQTEGLTWLHFPLSHHWSDRDGGLVACYPSPLTIAGEEWEPPEDMTDAVCGELVFRWVYTCWQTAGGASSIVRFYCHNYHTLDLFCLQRGRFVTQQEFYADTRSSPTA